MPRYFFHVYNRSGAALDEEGLELSDVFAARDHALRGIRSLLSAEVLTGKLDLHGHLDVAEPDGTKVARLEFGDALVIRPA
jgi:hypothetical protein